MRIYSYLYPYLYEDVALGEFGIGKRIIFCRLYVYICVCVYANL